MMAKKRNAQMSGDEDPFAAILKPPSDETPDQRAKRISEEQDAAKRSRDIDETLAAERREMDRKSRMVKVLLLGQAESGKSTTLKSVYLFCFLGFFRVFAGLDDRLTLYNGS